MKKNYYFREDFVVGENRYGEEENRENPMPEKSKETIPAKTTAIIKAVVTGETVSDSHPELYLG